MSHCDLFHHYVPRFTADSRKFQEHRDSVARIRCGAVQHCNYCNG